MKFRFTNEVIQIKGEDHPDSLVEAMAQIAQNTIQKKYPYLFANFDKSVLVGGKFPELILSGYMCFDFRRYSKEFRYEVQNEIKSHILSYFKNKFNDAYLKVTFNMNFEPSAIANIESSVYTNTISLTSFYEYSIVETFAIGLVSKLKEVSDDFNLVVTPNKVVINQTFKENNIDAVAYHEDRIQRAVNEWSKHYDPENIREVILNNDIQHTGTAVWSQFGSSLFYNTTGVCGRGNGIYGFQSSCRPKSTSIEGKYHSEDMLNMWLNGNERSAELFQQFKTPYQVTTVGIIGDPIGTYNMYESKLPITLIKSL